MISLGGCGAGASSKGCSGQRGETLSKAAQLVTCATHSSGLAIAIFGPALRGWSSELYAQGSFVDWTSELFDQECGKGGGDADNVQEVIPDRRVQPRDSTNGAGRATCRALVNSWVCGDRCYTTGTSSWDGGAVAAARRPPRPVTWPHGSQWPSPRWGWARQCWTGCLMNAGFPTRALCTLLNVRPPHRPFR